MIYFEIKQQHARLKCEFESVQVESVHTSHCFSVTLLSTPKQIHAPSGLKAEKGGQTNSQYPYTRGPVMNYPAQHSEL